MSSILQDGGAQIKVEPAGNVASFTAGTTYDNVEATLLTFDRLGFDSLSVVLQHLVTLTADKTLAATITIQHCDTAQGSYVDYVTAATDTVLATGALTANLDATKVDVDLSGAKRYILAQMSLDLNASGTDTAAVNAIYILSGARSVPTA